MSNTRANAPSWLLIEVFDPEREPTIVSIAGAPNRFRPLGSLFGNPRRRLELDGSIQRIRRSGDAIDVVADGRHIVAHPLFVEGRLHALWFWSQPDDVPVPPHNPAGAWVIDLTTYHALGSAEWAEMADIPEEHRGQERHVSAMFNQVKMNDGNESRALSLIEAKTVGVGYQGDWTVQRRDGSQWRAHFSLRILDVERGGEVHRCSIGVSQNLGEVPTEEPRSLASMEDHYLRLGRGPGEHVAIVSLRTLNFIRWVTDASDHIAWTGVAGEPKPAIHPDDLDTAVELMRRAESLARSEGQVRLRGADGSWLFTDVLIETVSLENEEHAAFVLLRLHQT